MKFFHLGMLIVHFGSFASAEDANVTPAMKADFEKRVRAALEQPNPAAWHALTHWAGVSPEGRKEREDLAFLVETWDGL